MSYVSALPDSSLRPLDLPIEKSKNDFNRYVFLDPRQDISSENIKKIVYKTLAIVAMVLFGAVVVGGVIALIHFAPILTPFFLVLAIAAYKRFHTHVITPVKQASEQAESNAIRCQELAQEIQKVQDAYNGYNSYRDLLRSIGIYSTSIPVDDLCQASGSSCYLVDLAPLIGRVNYWAKTEADTLHKIQKLEEQITAIHKKLETVPDPDLEIQKTQFKMEKQRLEELHLLPAKIAGAYALHVLSDMTDKRDFDAFGSCHPMSYLAHLEHQAEKKPQPYYYFPPESKKKSLTKEEMLRFSPLELSKRIFGDSKAFIR